MSAREIMAGRITMAHTIRRNVHDVLRLGTPHWMRVALLRAHALQRLTGHYDAIRGGE
jgi:hypothetical protein